VSTYDAVKDLPLEIESYDLEPLVQEVAANFSLRRTTVVLRGGGEEGRGEEVDYDPQSQQQFQERRGELPLWDPWTEAGTSILGQTTPGLFHPFTLLYLALPFDLAFKLNHLLPLLTVQPREA